MKIMDKQLTFRLRIFNIPAQISLSVSISFGQTFGYLRRFGIDMLHITAEEFVLVIHRGDRLSIIDIDAIRDVLLFRLSNVAFLSTENCHDWCWNACSNEANIAMLFYINAETRDVVYVASIRTAQHLLQINQQQSDKLSSFLFRIYYANRSKFRVSHDTLFNDGMCESHMESMIWLSEGDKIFFMANVFVKASKKYKIFKRQSMHHIVFEYREIKIDFCGDVLALSDYVDCLVFMEMMTTEHAESLMEKVRMTQSIYVDTKRNFVTFRELNDALLLELNVPDAALFNIVLIDAECNSCVETNAQNKRLYTTHFLYFFKFVV